MHKITRRGEWKFFGIRGVLNAFVVVARFIHRTHVFVSRKMMSFVVGPGWGCAGGDEETESDAVAVAMGQFEFHMQMRWLLS